MWDVKRFLSEFPNAKSGDCISVRYQRLFGLCETSIHAGTLSQFNGTGLFVAHGSKITFVPWKQVTMLLTSDWNGLPEAWR